MQNPPIWSAPAKGSGSEQAASTKKIRRIAFVCDTVSPWSKGGRETRLYQIAKRLIRDSQEVHVFTMKWWSGPDIVVLEGVHYHALCQLRPLYKKGRRSTAQAIMFSLAVFRLLFHDFDVLDVDQIPFFPLFSARIVAWIKRKKLIATWHEAWGRDYWMAYAGPRAGNIAHLIEQLSFRLPDLIIANSTQTTARLRSMGVACRIATVPLGVDLEAIAATHAAEVESDVIFVGRLISHKHADLLIEALALVKLGRPNVSALIVGTGPDEEKVKQLAIERALDKNISFVGEIHSNERIYSLMKASKLLVLPSSREGFGLVVLEANAAGIPVITVRQDNNAAQALIKPGVNGLIAEFDANDLAAKIVEALETRGQMRVWEGLAQYDWRVAAQRVEACLNDASPAEHRAHNQSKTPIVSEKGLEIEFAREGLSPYKQCPKGEPDKCRFGEPLSYAPDIAGSGLNAARVHQCAICGHGVTRPPIADVSILYKGRESQDYQQVDGWVAKTIKKFVFDRQARSLLRMVGGSPASIVDFACGSGFFTSRLAAATSANVRVVALDFFDEAPREMPGVEYYSFRRLPDLEDSADLLLCFHALEHDDDPDAFLDRLLSILKIGGTLVVEVPNMRCAWASILGAHWDNWYLPFHRLHFSRESLRSLLSRHGLEIEQEVDICIPSMGRSLARAFGRRQNLPFLISGIALHPLQWGLERVTRQPSALRVIARNRRSKS